MGQHHDHHSDHYHDYSLSEKLHHMGCLIPILGIIILTVLSILFK